MGGLGHGYQSPALMAATEGSGEGLEQLLVSASAASA
jgi:hypothetical protein